MAKPYTSPVIEKLQSYTYSINAANADALETKCLKQKQCRGYERPASAPIGYSVAAPVLEPGEINLIPYDEIFDRIKEQDEKEANGTFVNNEALAIKLGITPLNQGQTNLCWAFSATMMIEFLIAKQGGPILRLSPHAVACWLNGFKNEGGWPVEFVDKAARVGIPEVKYWKTSSNPFSRKNDTTDARENALKHVQLEYRELPVRGTNGRKMSVKARTQIAYSVVTQLGPYAGGYNWMSHAVTMFEAKIQKDKLVWLSRNSGLYRNSKGYTIFSEEHGAYDDGVVCTSSKVAA